MALTSAIEQVITQAVTNDSPQTVLSACHLPSEFDECLERVLQRQLQRQSEGIAGSWLRTQRTVAVHTPKSSSPIDAFYQQVLKTASPEKVAYDLRLRQDLIRKRSRSASDSVSHALLQLSETFTASVPVERMQKLLLSYLQGECSQADLKELGYSQNIDIDDKLFVLGTIFLCMLGQKAKIGTNGEVGPHSRIYLFLNQMENVLALSNETCWAFTHVLEHLTQDVGRGLTIWMNITTADAEIVQRVQDRLGSRLMREWVNHLCLEDAM